MGACLQLAGADGEVADVAQYKHYVGVPLPLPLPTVFRVSPFKSPAAQETRVFGENSERVFVELSV